MSGPSAINSVCVVAIIKDEGAFLMEWIAYHRIIGITHFFLYDDGSSPPLSNSIKQFSEYVTIIPWNDEHTLLEGRNRQTKAYLHATRKLIASYEWVAFIDCDEFLVFPQHDYIQPFLDNFPNAGCISLNWLVFGHNGHYEDPEGLVTASFTRRRSEPSERVKSICRTKAITNIPSAHYCLVKRGWHRVDPNNIKFRVGLYPGRTRLAHVNHYQCRSFIHWRNRVTRGDVAFDTQENLPPNQRWRFEDLENLKQFVTTVAVYNNELVDEHMKKFEKPICDLLGMQPACRPVQ